MLQQSAINKNLEIPEDILCPITSQIMTDPVMIESGNTYEREAILKWLKNNNTDPLTNDKLNSKTVTPNRTVKRMIVTYLDKQKEKNPGIMHETYLPDALIQTLILSLQKNEIKLFTETLGKDVRLLSNDLQDNKNLFMLACEFASLEILNIVLNKLENKIKNLSCVQENKVSALFFSVCRRLGVEGAKSFAKALEWKPSDIQQLLYLSVATNDIEIVEITLQLGTVATSSLLNKAYHARATAMVKTLLLAGAVIKTEDTQGNNFFMRTIKDNEAVLSLFIISNLADKIIPTKLNTEKQSAIHIATQQNQFNLVKALLNHPKTEIDQPNGKKENALHIAVSNNHLPIAQLLIENKINLNAKNGQDQTAIDIAYQQYNEYDFEILKTLIQSSAQINDLLLKSILNQQTALVSYLLIEAAQQINPNIIDAEGKSALMSAVEKNHLETIKLLLKHPKINVGQTDPKGNTALHFAAMQGNKEIIQLLMKQLASIKDKNIAQQTPVQLARKNNHPELANWMEERHRYKKVKPFLKPMKIEIQTLKQENHQQVLSLKQENHALREELKNLKENVTAQKSSIEKFSIFKVEHCQSLMTLAEKEQHEKILKYQEEQRQKALKDLAVLLKWVTEGHLLEVEKLLQKNPELALMTGTVTDLSNRKFNNITIFQYAVWALDIDMWNMILKYLDKQSALSQLQSLATNHTN